MAQAKRLPNGFGTVYKLKGFRRRPWVVRITDGWTADGKQIRKIIDYAETRADGIRKLTEYIGNPYNLDYKGTTINDIYEIIEPKLKEDSLNEIMSASNYRNITNAYNNHLQILHNKKIMELKKRDLQLVIDTSNACHTTKGYMKNVLSRIYSYAIDELELPITKNPAMDLKIGIRTKSELHIPFTLEEIQIIKKDNSFISNLLLISLYTGLRPKELVELRTENVFLEKKYMIGGCKTKAGINRIIPIHDDIIGIIENFLQKDKKYLINSSLTQRNITADYYSKSVKKYFQNIGMNHTAYDTRHTFATRCDEVGISPINIKILMGHSLANDVTNNVYIHKSVDLLLEEIKKLNYDL